MEAEVKCPTPYKPKFGTEEDANIYRTANYPRDYFMEAYQCRCSSWHLGHGKDTAALFNLSRRGRR